jgi:TolB protein
MTRNAGLVLVAVAMGLAWLGSEGAQAAFPGENGLIAFSRGSDKPLSSDIWAMNPDGSGEVRLTCPAEPDPFAHSPAWSADGRRTAYGRETGEVHSFFHAVVLNPDGTTHSIGGHSTQPAWSPDGEWIALTGTGYVFDGPFPLRVVRADGSEGTPIPDTDGGSAPAWSPDGEWIAFGIYGTIGLTTRDGSEQARVGPRTDSRFPAWSPDGEWIAFSRAGDIWTMRADGSKLTRLTDTPAGDFRAAWSPDGRGSPSQELATSGQ